MDETEIRSILEGGLGAGEIRLQSEGNKLMLLIVSPKFDGLSRVKRQQLVYGLLNDKISSGEIHAVSMRCLAPGEADA
ncbi:MAG: BolA/IbaG family iron-sulfur metabolism protein [Pseudomonadales bacterium]|nr:BolA/IbaG family iron-sulfur metabolism protein [Pseudomonadales bacterium]